MGGSERKQMDAFEVTLLMSMQEIFSTSANFSITSALHLHESNYLLINIIKVSLIANYKTKHLSHQHEPAVYIGSVNGTWCPKYILLTVHNKNCDSQVNCCLNDVSLSRSNSEKTANNASFLMDHIGPKIHKLHPLRQQQSYMLV